ncbi:MAG: RecQ family ATP-dependent DNA helicase [Gemmatimonadales bacterium]
MHLPATDALAAARAVLARHFGFTDFRPLQQRVVEAVLSGRDVLAVLPTGAGKSACFQVPAMLREGFILVLSPLISLMQDQVAAARERGLPAAALNSALSPAGQRAVLDQCAAGLVRLLYTSPERLPRLERELAERAVRPVAIAVDEAHCISEWGHDFRPSYRALGRLRAALGSPPVLALTGSATPEVRRDIRRTLRLRPGAAEVVGSFDRRNLAFIVRLVTGESGRLSALLEELGRADRIAIVYAPTRRLTEALARTLARHGRLAAPYHAGLAPPERKRTLQRFLDDDLEVVVATCAFGMGIDKPTVRLVVHWLMPPTPESYYQEAGRAGRDGRPARCVLLYRAGDAALHRRQLDVTFPSRDLLERARHDPGQLVRLPAAVQASLARLARELGPDPSAAGWQAVRGRRRLAERRIAAMEAYAGGATCRRRALVGWFGERLPRCSGCDRCGPSPSVPPVGPAPLGRDAALVAHALRCWRDGVAHAAGLPRDDVLGDAALSGIACTRPQDRRALGLIPNVGPRALARFAEPILALVASSEHSPPTPRTE